MDSTVSGGTPEDEYGALSLRLKSLQDRYMRLLEEGSHRIKEVLEQLDKGDDSSVRELYGILNSLDMRLPYPAAILSGRGLILDWNTAAENVLRYDKDEILGTSVLDLFPISEMDKIKSFVNRLKETRRSGEIETYVLSNDFRLVKVKASIAPILDGNKPIGYIIVFRT
jgi:PAS domain S-box-containing protein